MVLRDDDCYRALQTRDARFDGRFFTGVRTTGIYCRPVCPARTPLRKNVVFFTCAAAAEAAGFRPCLRCRPETAPGTPRWLGTSATVSRALRLIDGGALDDGDVANLAADVGVGERQLRRLFAHHLGASPLAMASSRRAHQARLLLDATGLPVAQIAFASGFGSLRQFNAAIRECFHTTPTGLRHARRGGAPAGGSCRFRLPFRPPFAWDQLLRFFAARAIRGLERVEGGCYRRSFTSGGAAGSFEVALEKGGNALELSVDGAPPSALLAVVQRVRQMFDLDADPMAIADTLSRTPVLADAVRQRPGLRVPGTWEPFEALVRGVVGQQISVSAATTICGRIVQRWGQPVKGLSGLTHAFPKSASIARADLTAAGLPRARAQNLSRLATRIAEQPVLLSPPQDLQSLVETLCSLPGVGPWTAQYVAMRGFNEPDAFPERDLGLLRGVGGLSWRELEAAMSLVRPFRAYAAVHLWAVDSSEVRHVARAVAS
jgi:AraC family transcriptional regulator, regulatory protein of adaptative response / DNA-3-methyladenine glycosylase II